MMSLKSGNPINLQTSQKHTLIMLPDQPISIFSYPYLKNEFSNARRYEKGICDDQDPEFLHQYRICLRRTRAIVSLLKDIFPDHERKRLCIALKNVMQKTNLVRDLDVYIMKRKMFFKQLKHKHHQGLVAFFDDIESRRTTEFDALRYWLRGEDYPQQCQKIALYLRAMQESPSSQHAKIPSRAYASKAINKQLQKVCHRARHIDKKSKDSRIHKLRIDCKKLRYLLEYFEPLFKKNRYQRQLNNLKKLQNCLGDFNDSSVQCGFLSHYLAHINKRSSSYDVVKKLIDVSEKCHHQAKSNVFQQLNIFVEDQSKRDRFTTN